MEDLKTVEGKVRRLLEQWPELRSSDRMLIASYYKRYHGVTTFHQYAISPDLPSTETIRRTRQKIQAEGVLLANERTQELRDALIQKYSDYAVGKG